LKKRHERIVAEKKKKGIPPSGVGKGGGHAHNQQNYTYLLGKWGKKKRKRHKLGKRPGGEIRTSLENKTWEVFGGKPPSFWNKMDGKKKKRTPNVMWGPKGKKKTALAAVFRGKGTTE